MSTQILTHGRVTWTYIVHPTQEDITQLARRYPHFHPLNLQDCLTEVEFPKLDHHDEYLFLVMQIPVWDPRERISRPAEVDIFIASGTLVTIHQDVLKPLREMYARFHQDESLRVERMEQGASPLLYEILKELIDYCFPILHKVDHHLRTIENNLFCHDTYGILNELANTRRDIIALRHILKPQVEVIRQLESGSWSFIHEDLDLYWGDIGDHLVQLCAILDEDAEVIAGLSDTIDTLASHRIDEVVRLLTIVTVLTLPVTLLATLFGMNVALPYSQHPGLFFSIVGLGVVATLLLVYYLRHHRWL